MALQKVRLLINFEPDFEIRNTPKSDGKTDPVCACIHISRVRTWDWPLAIYQNRNGFHCGCRWLQIYRGLILHAVCYMLWKIHQLFACEMKPHVNTILISEHVKAETTKKRRIWSRSDVKMPDNLLKRAGTWMRLKGKYILSPQPWEFINLNYYLSSLRAFSSKTV